MSLAESVHNGIQMGILVVDRRENIISCNDWLLAAAGLKRSEAEGLPFISVFALASGCRMHSAVQEVVQHGRPVVLSQALNSRPLPLYVQLADGPNVPMEQAISLVRIARPGEADCCLVQINDVTPMVAREQRLRELSRNAEMARLKVQRTAEQLDTLNLVLQARSKDLADFAHASAHDLKAPMRHMAGLARIVMEDCKEQLGGETVRHLELLMEAGTRGTRVVDDLLRFAEARRPETLTRIDLNEMLKQALANLQGELSQSGAVIRQQELDEVIGYETGLMLVFQNLIGNAIKYCTADTPHISIESLASGDNIEVRISDNGVGVPIAERETIFEPFRRVHQEIAEGSGIGLATCKRVLEDCGGTIWVEPTEGGSVFVFRCRQS